MNDGIDLRIIGDKQVDDMLNQLNNIDRNTSIKFGLRKGGQILVSAGKSRLRARMKNPSGVTGNLLKSFQVKVKKNKLGALAGFGMIKDNKGGKHSYLVDLGTDKRYKKNGAYTGVMPALKYWTDTRNEDMDTAIDAVWEGVEMAIIKIQK